LCGTTGMPAARLSALFLTDAFRDGERMSF
jgi:hypothetical protein